LEITKATVDIVRDIHNNRHTAKNPEIWSPIARLLSLRLKKKKTLVFSFSLVVGPPANLQPTLFLKVEIISIWLKIIFWIAGIFFLFLFPWKLMIKISIGLAGKIASNNRIFPCQLECRANILVFFLKNRVGWWLVATTFIFSNICQEKSCTLSSSSSHTINHRYFIIIAIVLWHCILAKPMAHSIIK